MSWSYSAHGELFYPNGAVFSCSVSDIPGWLQAEPRVLPVLHHGKLLLAPGGGAIPPHPAGGHILPQPTLRSLSPDWMG